MKMIPVKTDANFFAPFFSFCFSFLLLYLDDNNG